MADPSEDRFRFVTGPVREGCRQAHLYNEGVVIFYYDASHLEQVTTANPTILEYFNEEVLQDQKLDGLFHEGALVLHLLAEDGGADLEVVVGHDLTAEEKQGGQWLDAQSAWIALPSGRLRIDTYNTAPFSDGDDEGAEIEVPPGEYRLTLHSKDWDGMDAAGDDRLEQASEAGIEVYDAGRVDDVVVLTPLSAGDARPARGILFEDLYTAAPEAPPSPSGAVLLDGEAGVFRTDTLDDDPKLEEIGVGMKGLGLAPLGDFTLDQFGGVRIRGWAGPSLQFVGIASQSPFGGRSVDLYTVFDDGASLTTSNVALPEDRERGIYRRFRRGGTVEELHEAHIEGLSDHAAAGRTPLQTVATLVALVRAIDEFVSRQQR